MKKRITKQSVLVTAAAPEEKLKKPEWHPLWLLLFILLLAALFSFMFFLIPVMRRKSIACDKHFSVAYNPNGEDFFSASTLIIGEVHRRNLNEIVACVQELATDNNAMLLLETHSNKKDKPISCHDRVKEFATFNHLGFSCYALEGAPTDADIRSQEHRYLATFIRDMHTLFKHAPSPEFALQGMEKVLIYLKDKQSEIIKKLPKSGPKLFKACQKIVNSIRGKDRQTVLNTLNDKKRFHLQKAEIAIQQRHVAFNELLAKEINHRRKNFEGKIIAIVGVSHAAPEENKHLAEIDGGVIVLQSNQYQEVVEQTHKYYKGLD